jgi:protein-disulfide isomerase
MNNTLGLVVVPKVTGMDTLAPISGRVNNAATDPGEPPQGSGIDQETGAVVVGDGEQSMDTYIDFMCPICGQFEEAYGDAILELVDDGTITLNIHPISILDRYSQGTEYSTRAANAMYCVAEADPPASP